MYKMKISEILEHAGENFGITQVIIDAEFVTMGLLSADTDLEICTFIDNEKYIDIRKDNAKMIITNKSISDKLLNVGKCISDNPRVSYFKLHNYLTNFDEYKIREDFKSIMGEDCSISEMAHIAKNNVKIGNNVVVEEFVSIKENTIIEDNTIIRAGSIIGGEGYEFKRMDIGKILPVKHVGWTYIGNNVEIQQNTCIDKAIYPWDSTFIGDYCKIDNLVHVAHGVKLSSAVFLVAGSLLGGRTIIKQNTWVGVGATVSNGLIIGKESSINIGAVVTKNLNDRSSVTGNFAIDHEKFINFIKSIR